MLAKNEYDDLSTSEHIDLSATIRSVKHFFEHDLRLIQLSAHKTIVSITSPVIDGMPKTPSTVNRVELAIINRIYAKNLVNEVYNAMHACSPIGFNILMKRYGAKYTDDKTRIMSHLSNTQYYREKKIALIDFAIAFKDTLDLISYNKN